MVRSTPLHLLSVLLCSTLLILSTEKVSADTKSKTVSPPRGKNLKASPRTPSRLPTQPRSSSRPNSRVPTQTDLRRPGSQSSRSYIERYPGNRSTRYSPGNQLRNPGLHNDHDHDHDGGHNHNADHLDYGSPYVLSSGYRSRRSFGSRHYTDHDHHHYDDHHHHHHHHGGYPYGIYRGSSPYSLNTLFSRMYGRGRYHHYDIYSPYFNYGGGYGGLNIYRGPLGISIYGSTPYYNAPYDPYYGYHPSNPYGYNPNAPFGYDPRVNQLPLGLGQPNTAADPFRNRVLDQARQEEFNRWRTPLSGPNAIPARGPTPDPVSQPGVVDQEFQKSLIPIPKKSSAEAYGKSVAYEVQANQWIRQQSYRNAYSKYKSALDVAPDRTKLHFKVAYALVAINQYSTAVDYLKKGLLYHPDWPQKGDSFSQFIGTENKLAKSSIIQRVVGWAKEDIRDPDRLFLAGVILHFENPTQARPMFETAYRMLGGGQHLVAFLHPEQLRPGSSKVISPGTSFQPTPATTPIPVNPIDPRQPRTPSLKLPANSQPSSDNGIKLQGNSVVVPNSSTSKPSASDNELDLPIIIPVDP